MKIRLGHISNSSSCSFTVPSFLLTDEQKEMILAVDDGERAKLHKMLGTDIDTPNYPKNDEYHRICKKMIDDGDWGDSGWSIKDDKEYGIIWGSTMMGNGSIQQLMEKIGIDLTTVQNTNHGHMSVDMATNPKAVQHFIWLHKKILQDWNAQSDKDKKFDIEYGHKPMKETPYALDDDKFRPFGDDGLRYTVEEEEDQEIYCYYKSTDSKEKKHEN